MQPKSLDDANALGWIKITPDEARILRKLHPDSSDLFMAAVDCNKMPDGTRCGGFGPSLSGSIACFCKDGLCECYRAPSFAIPPS